MGFHTEFYEFREMWIFASFKNNFFSSGQGVVKIKPESAWSITSVPRKKLLFHTELLNFAKMEF